MVQYLLYKRSDTVTPFVIVNENTVDSTSTTVYLVGKRKEAYGQPEQQSKLWLLENFANNVQPAPAMTGQEWFNTADGKMYVCTDATTQTFEKVSRPIVSATTPSSGIIKTGDLWYNTANGLLYVYDASIPAWVQSSSGFTGIPTTVQQVAYLTAITNDSTPTEMFVSGTPNSRLVIPANQSWNFEISLIGRRNANIGEVISMKFAGTFDRPDATPVNIVGGVAKTVYGISSTLTGVDATVAVDVGNNALTVLVTGETAKIINWVATATLNIVSNP